MILAPVLPRVKPFAGIMHDGDAHMVMGLLEARHEAYSRVIRYGSSRRLYALHVRFSNAYSNRTRPNGKRGPYNVLRSRLN